MIEYTDEGDIASRLNKLKMDLFDMFGNRLKLNLMTGDYELDCGHVDINNAKSFISDKLGRDYSTENCILAIHAIASRHAYHPVKQYLESLKDNKVAQDFDILDNISGLFLGNPDPLASKMMAKTLVGAAARVMKPGTKVDTLTVLQGEQGFMKSTFLKVLGTEKWFCDDIRDLENKDELAKLVRYWMIELAEVDYLMGRKEVESFKRFLSSTADTYRPPYGRTNIRHDRTCALFATTNKNEFLKDPTGNRRYWVIKVGVKIDCNLVAKFRDIIWASALAAYERGDTWWLDNTEEILRAEGSEEFREPDAWEEPITSQWNKLTLAEYKGCECVEIDQIFDLLDIDNTQRNRSNRIRIASILRHLGFESKAITTDSGKVKVWLKAKSGHNSSKEELDKCENLKSKVLEKYHFSGFTTDVTKSEIGLEAETDLEPESSCSSPAEVAQSVFQQAKEMEPDSEPKIGNLDPDYNNDFQSGGTYVGGSQVLSQVPVITLFQSQLHAKQNTTSPVLEPESDSTSNEALDTALALLEPENLRKRHFEIGEKNNRFNVGDRVRSVGGMIRYSGWTGTVNKIVNGPNCVIDWDNGKKTESIPFCELEVINP